MTGLAIRFPSSIKLPSSIESGFASVLWVKWTRGDWEPAFLLGFSVNVGCFPTDSRAHGAGRLQGRLSAAPWNSSRLPNGSALWKRRTPGTESSHVTG